MDFLDGLLENEVEKLHENMQHLDVELRDIYKYQVDSNCILNKLAELEDRSSRNNFCVDGIKEEKNETLEMCETKVKEISQEKLEIEEDIITERANRTK